LYTPDVRARFDIVGFDPRGVGRSTAMRCFGTVRQLAPVLTPFAYPISQEEIDTWIATDLYVDAACAKRGGRLLDHMSTANVVRDLDRLRSAVGDERLTYAGFSYGSYVGITYANLFPDNVRAIIIDGIIDPIAWATGYGNDAATTTVFTRLGSAKGTQDTLHEFFRLCDAGGPTRCALAPNAESRFAALADRLRQGAITIPLPDGSVMHMDYSNLIVITLSYLYYAPVYPELAEILAGLESQADLAAVGRTLAGLEVFPGLIPKRGLIKYSNYNEAQVSVVCSDTDNPHSYTTWEQDAIAAESRYGYFGPPWSWVVSICAQWPGSDSGRYVGPFNRRTRNPVLVIGEQFDPATPYENAVTVADTLPGAALLTVYGWGHSANASFLSTCAIDVAGRYLTEVQVPPPGTVCNEDFVPFAP
jgi:pimeloyl-ACP methyl ester carboxylesterase